MLYTILILNCKPNKETKKGSARQKKSPGVDSFQLSIIINTEVKNSMNVLGLIKKKQEGGLR